MSTYDVINIACSHSAQKHVIQHFTPGGLTAIPDLDMADIPSSDMLIIPQGESIAEEIDPTTYGIVE